MDTAAINDFPLHHALSTSFEGSLLLLQLLSNATRNATNLHEPDSAVINNITSYEASSQAPQLDLEVSNITLNATSLQEPDSAVINNITSYEASSQAPQFDMEAPNTTLNGKILQSQQEALQQQICNQSEVESKERNTRMELLRCEEDLEKNNLKEKYTRLELLECKDLYEKSQQESLRNITFLQLLINTQSDIESKDRENERINLLKCEEDLYENSQKIAFVMDSLIRDDEEGCVLKQMVEKRNLGIVNELLNHGANVNGVCGGSTILHAAAATNDEQLIQIVLDKGADVNKEDSNGLTPVQLAAIEGYDKAVIKLAGISADKKYGGSRDKLSHLAAKAGHVSVLTALHNLFPTKMVKEKNSLGETPLLVAVANGHLDTVKALKNMGADLDRKDKFGYNALHKAINGTQNDILDYLLSLKRYNVNEPIRKGNKPVHLAFLRGQEDMANKLIYAGADIWSEGADGQTALHFAAYSNMEGFLRRLLGGPLDINKRTKYNKTPLHLAVREKSKEAVKVLIDWKGVDLNAKDNHGDTPLHFAATINAEEITEELLKKGADRSAKNTYNYTSLDVAILYKNYEVAFMLK